MILVIKITNVMLFQPKDEEGTLMNGQRETFCYEKRMKRLVSKE